MEIIGGRACLDRGQRIAGLGQSWGSVGGRAAASSLAMHGIKEYRLEN